MRRISPTVLTAIQAERDRQDDRWGEQHHGPDGWLAILIEEVGEVARAILEGRGTQYHDELVQVAAVAIAALESADRGHLEIGSLVKAQGTIKLLKARLERYE